MKNNIPNNVLVDDCDREMLENMGKWYISNTGYCMKNSSSKLGKQRTLIMHRIIMQPASDMQVDHINGNRLDNRRENLRIVTQHENQWNRTTAKGYTWRIRLNKWEAQITKDYKKISLGLYDTEEEAAAAYISAKKQYHIIMEDV